MCSKMCIGFRLMDFHFLFGRMMHRMSRIDTREAINLCLNLSWLIFCYCRKSKFRDKLISNQFITVDLYVLLLVDLKLNIHQCAIVMFKEIQGKFKEIQGKWDDLSHTSLTVCSSVMLRIPSCKKSVFGFN